VLKLQHKFGVSQQLKSLQGLIKIVLYFQQGITVRDNIISYIFSKE